MPRFDTPTVTRTPTGLLLTSENRNLAANLGAVVRYAMARTSSEESCAALLEVSVERLREVADDARVPLVFAAEKAGKGVLQ